MTVTSPDGSQASLAQLALDYKVSLTNIGS